MSTTAIRPLEGVKVLDLSTVIAGPYGSEHLGYLGADVVRVSPPPAAPAFTPHPKGEMITKANARLWAMQRNKRSICLDLKDPGDLETFYDLVRVADVVYDNFRPGVLDRLKIDYQTLKKINKRIISCSITGFGSKGPWAEVASYDIVVQACSGAMATTGTGDGVPCRWGVPVGDICAALYAIIGIFGALEERERTGEGQAIDVSMLDTQLALNLFRVPQTFGAGMHFSMPSQRRGGAGAVPYGPFLCGDNAWIVVGVSSNYWKRFCAAMQLPELENDPRFRSLPLRQENQAALDAILEQAFLKDSAAAWEARLMEAEVPAGRVNSIREAFEDPQAVARGMLVTMTGPGGQEIKLPGNPIHFAGEAPFGQRPPSPAGADTQAVLSEWLGRSARAKAAPADGELA